MTTPESVTLLRQHADALVQSRLGGSLWDVRVAKVTKESDGLRVSLEYLLTTMWVERRKPSDEW